jgi:replicative DNA helicase
MAKQAEWLAGKLDDLDDEAFEEVIDRATTRAATIEHKHNDELVHISELQDELKEVRSERGKLRGLSTGYKALDAKMGGLEAGSVILFGGETSNGKSALATNIGVRIAQQGKGVLYISLEMTKKQMLERLDIMTDGDPMSINFMFQKAFSLDYKDLAPLMKKADGKAELVILDYLQYLGRGMTESEVAKMSKQVKALALEHKVPFLVIVSLRKGDNKFKRKWTDIEIEDLMGTAAIGYDCDTAIVVSRKDQENEFDKDRIYVKVLKTRNTELDFKDRYVQLKWKKTKITDDPDAWVNAVFPGAKVVEESSDEQYIIT